MNNVSVYLTIDKYTIPFRSYSVPLNFVYNMYHNRVSSNSGVIYLNKVHISICRPISTNNTFGLKFVYSKSTTVFTLGNPTTIKHAGFEYYDMTFNVKDIWNKYNELISIIPECTKFCLHCSFDTPMICNLHCHYCSKSMNSLSIPDTTDKYLTSIYTKRILQILKSNFKTSGLEQRYHRVMGGEPLIDKDVFLNHINWCKKFVNQNSPNNSTTFQIYTNGTIRDSYSYLIDFMESDVTYNSYDIWFTVDTFVLSKSDRFENNSHIRYFTENISKLLDYSKHTHQNIRVMVNVMYKDFLTTSNTIKKLMRMGITMFEIAFDDELIDANYIKFRKEKRHMISELIRKNGCQLMKSHSYKLFPIFFNIKQFDEVAFRASVTYWSNNNCVAIYDYE